jgi:sortase A
MKRLTIALIIIGILIAAYPLMERAYTSYWQNKIYAQIDENANEQSVEAYQELQDVFESDINIANDEQTYSSSIDDGYATIEEEKAAITDEKNKDVVINYLDRDVGDIIGNLTIDKIDLEIPVLYGATDANMKKGAGQIIGTSPVGTVGNVALAAHRSYTYGRFFNRLDEINVGDIIRIEKNNKTYEYKVYTKKVVEPTDVSVLNKNDTHKVLTLITCTPIKVATHRLIIHAEQIN